MEFKIPPGNLSWLSALWILLGGYVGITSIQAGETALGGTLLAFALAGVLIWLDVRAIAWPLMVWFGIVIVSGLLFRPNLRNLNGSALDLRSLCLA